MFKYNSTIFKEQLTSISTVLNNTGNTTKLLTSFSALDVAQQKVLLSSKLLTEEQKVQCATMATLTSANTKYTAEQIAKATGVSAETLANWGLIKSTDTLTISELAEKAASDAQAKSVLEKIIAQNAQAVANGEVTASNVTLAASEGGATLATGAFTTAIKANISAMKTWLLTTPAGWLTMLVGGIFLAVKAYDALTDSVEETKEKAEDLISTYKTALDTANSHKESIDNIADRYEELSKGVNNLGENVSLTAEEYQEYNSIVNDIAEMFPTMVQGYTDEGNAILKLKGNVDDLREAYEAEAQAAYNSLISTGKDSDGNDILKDANNVITGSTLGAHDWGNAEKIDYLDKLMDATDSVDSMLNLWDESLNSAYSEWFEDFAGVGGTANIGKLTDEDLANIRKNAKILKQQYQAEIDSAVDNAETLANAYLMTNEDYAKLDEQSKNAASIMVNSLNADIVSKFGEDKENVGKYVDDIVQIISTNPDAKDAMIGLFTMDTTDMPVDDIEYWTNAYIDTIAKILQEDPTELKIRLGFDNDTTEPLKTKVQGFLKDEFDGKVGELTLEELNIASELKIPEGTLLSWNELIAKIEEVKNASPDKTDIQSTITSSIEQISTQLEPQFSKLKDAYQSIFTIEDGKQIFSLDDVDASMLEDLRKSFAEIEEEIGVTFDASQLENFFAVLTNGNSTAEEVQNAFNGLATSYLFSTDVLNSLNDTTVDAIAKQLESLGVTNATALATEVLATKQEYLAQTGQDLSDATAENINALIDEKAEITEEGIVLDSTTQKIVAYWMQKQAANGQLSTIGDIQQLSALCDALGISTKALRNYIYFKKLASMTDVYDDNTIAIFAENAEKQMEQAQKDIQSIYAGFGGTNLDYSPIDSKKASKSAKETSETFDWIETKISRLERKIENLDRTASATWRQWTQRNTALGKEISKVTEEIDIQRQAYDRYMQEANSVGLSEVYAEKVRNGKINIETLTDEDLIDKINSYQDFYEKALDAEDKIAELADELASKYEENFNNIQKQFEEQLSMLEHSMNMIEGYLDLQEAKGYLQSTKFYEQLISYEKQNLPVLQSEYNSLVQALNDGLNSGAIQLYSETWYDLMENINDVEESIQDANKALVDYQNTMRETQWGYFDTMQSYISNISDEADFLMDLLDNNPLFEKNGSITDNGFATLALQASKYNTYMYQADDYAKEIVKIEEELAKDRYDTKLIERKQELIDLQRDSIKAAEEEKQAMRDLAEEGYNTALDYLNELISKYKEAMTAQKDLFDYEKNISEQTSNISSIQKQIQAFMGDNSEENQNRIQQLNKQLEDAKDKLEETQYDQWITDTEKILDNLSDEFQEWINQRLDNFEQLFADQIEAVNNNGQMVKDILESDSYKVGYSLSDEMKSIFSTQSLTDTVGKYMPEFGVSISNVSTTLDGIKALVEDMVNTSNEQAKEPDSIQPSDTNTPATSVTQTTPITSTPTNPSGSGDGTANVGDKVTLVSGRFYAAEDGSGASGNDKGQWNGKEVYITKIHPGAKHPYHISTGSTLGNGNLGWLDLEQLRGYKTGIKNSPDEWAWTQEDGKGEIIRTKDGAILTHVGAGGMVFNNKQSEALWELSKNMTSNINPFNDMKLPQLSERNNAVVNNDLSVTITLPSVENYNDFVSHLKKDGTFERYVQEVTFGQGLKRNTLNKNKY